MVIIIHQNHLASKQMELNKVLNDAVKILWTLISPHPKICWSLLFGNEMGGEHSNLLFCTKFTSWDMINLFHSYYSCLQKNNKQLQLKYCLLIKKILLVDVMGNNEWLKLLYSRDIFKMVNELNLSLQGLSKFYQTNYKFKN